MGGLSFCFSNEPCIRKGVKREWETGRRPAYQAGFAPFLIWGECPSVRGQRPRTARRPHASSPSSASKNPCGKRAKPAKLQPGGQSASQPPPHREGTALERHGGPPLLPIPRQQKPLRQAGKARGAAAGRPTARPPQPQPGGHRPRYASTTISSFVSRAV